MYEVTSAAGEAASTGEGYDALASLNDGFLGTGSSSVMELSFVAMALIAIYVAHSTVRYCWPEFSLFRTLTGTLGLGDS